MTTKGTNTRSIYEKIMKKYLNCSICLDDYTKPKTLPCTHTFCLECLEAHVKGSADNGCFPCAYCREIIDIPPGGVSAFRTSHLFMSLQDDLKGGKLLRRDAAWTVHGQCQDHKDEMFRYYCVPCDRRICRDCKILGHQDHTVVSMQIAAVGKREDLKQSLELLAVKEHEAEKSVERLNSAVAHLQKHEQSSIKNIKKETEKIVSKLRKHADRRVEEVRAFHEKERNNLKPSIEENELRLNQAKETRAKIALILENGSDGEILENGNDLKKKTNEL